MKNNDESVLDQHGQFKSDLPIFDDSNIENTNRVWSWNHRFKIVGTCADDLKIIKRTDI